MCGQSPMAPLPAAARFAFADGVDGAWTAGTGTYQPINCAIDGYVYFHWAAAWHDVVLLASKEAYDACDFTGSKTLAPVGSPADPVTGQASYYLPCDAGADTMYVACSVSGHCAAGQKVAVHVSPDERAFDMSTAPPTVLLHSDSLANVMRLLGYRVDAASGHSYLERGYHTEASANVTLEMIWCLESHCPTSAMDFDIGTAWSENTCKAMVNQLGGFVERKRPTPQLALAEKYYLAALSYDSAHCSTLSYLTELYLMTANVTFATATAKRLCGTCALSNPPAVSQAKVAYDTKYPGVAEWPCALYHPPSPPLPPGEAIFHEVSTTLTLSGAVADFDRDSFTTKFAQAAQVVPSAVRLAVTPASVLVVATVTAPDAVAANTIALLLTTVTASTAVASSSFGVTVERVDQPPTYAAVARTPLDASSGSNQAVIIGAAAGGAAVALLLTTLLYCHLCRKPRRSSATLPIKPAAKAQVSAGLRTDCIAGVSATPSTSIAIGPNSPSLPPSPPTSGMRVFDASPPRVV